MSQFKKHYKRFIDLKGAGEKLLNETEASIPDMDDNISKEDILFEPFPSHSINSYLLNFCGYEFLFRLFIDSKMFSMSSARHGKVDGWNYAGRFEWFFLNRTTVDYKDENKFTTEPFSTLRFTNNGNLWGEELKINPDYEVTKALRILLRSGINQWPEDFPLNFLTRSVSRETRGD